MKFSTKIAGLFLVTLIITGAVVSYFAYQASMRGLEDQIKRRLEDEAYHTVDKMDMLLFERRAELKALANDPVIRSRNSTTGQITERLALFKTAYKQYISIALFDTDRVRLADTSGMNIGEQHDFLEYWPAIAEGKEFHMVITLSESSGGTVFCFTAVVKDEKGAPFRVIVSKMPVDNLYAIASRTDVRQAAEALRVDLVDGNGLLLYSNYDKEGILKTISPDWNFVKPALSTGITLGSMKYTNPEENTGEEILVFAHEQGYLEFRGNDWTVIEFVPTSVAFAPAGEMRDKIIIIFFSFTVIGIIVFMVFSGKITKPVEELSRAAFEMGKGNLDINVEVQSHDEIGRLSGSFNKMAADLREHRDGLEAKIAERTEELVKANEEIRKLNRDLEQKVEERTRQLVEAQEELVKKEKLSVLGQLAGSVGHELRNPLGVISNAVYYLKTVNQDSDETVREYLDMIKDEVNNSEYIISDLLDFARTKTPETKEIPVHDLVGRSIGKCSVPGNVTLTIDISETLPLIEIDPMQMSQVFQNLITNAVQAMPGGGTLRIAARRSTMQDTGYKMQEEKIVDRESCIMDQGVDFVEISVSDTGEGISREDMKKLFQPLFTTKAKGIGLGLVVCRKLTEANRGTIGVESEPGRGTTFRVALPAAVTADALMGL